MEFVEWDELLRRMSWDQGEHVMLIGPTGQGKTTAAHALLEERERRDGWVLAIATKPMDKDMLRLANRSGYKVIRDWPPEFSPANRIILWPRFSGDEDKQHQKETIERAFADIFSRGGYCLYLDEISWLSDELSMDSWLSTLWAQGRALKITVVGGNQRPRNIPVIAYSSATHVLLWRTNDQDDLRRIGGLGVFDKTRIQQRVADLPEFHFLYMNTRTSAMYESVAPSPDG